MELRQLRYFITVGRMASITKAAEKLHVSQPNITTAIRKLESELGVALFHRRQKRLSLTPRGQAFLEQIEKALEQIQSAVKEITGKDREQAGFIRIGIPPTIGAVMFPSMLSRFNEYYPGIELAVMEEGTWLIADKIKEGALDLGLLILSETEPGLETMFLSKQQVMVCLPPGHALEGQTAVRMDELANESLILLGEHSYHHHIILPEFARRGIKPRVVFSTNQVETIKGLVASRLGISFLFEGLTRSLPGITVKPFMTPLYVNLGLVWKKDAHLSKAARTFIEFFQGLPGVHDE